MSLAPEDYDQSEALWNSGRKELIKANEETPGFLKLAYDILEPLPTEQRDQAFAHSYRVTSAFLTDLDCAKLDQDEPNLTELTTFQRPGAIHAFGECRAKMIEYGMRSTESLMSRARTVCRDVCVAQRLLLDSSPTQQEIINPVINGLILWKVLFSPTGYKNLLCTWSPMLT